MVAELGDGSGARKTTIVVAEAQLVAVGEPAPAADPLAVEERAVAREPVVGDRPLAADPLDLGVQARDLLVGVEARRRPRARGRR